jgi:hypothetical protein
MTDEMITIAAAAATLGRDATIVRSWATAGRIPGAVWGPTGRGTRYGWLVPRAEVERLLAEWETTGHQSPAARPPRLDHEGQPT